MSNIQLYQKSELATTSNNYILALISTKKIFELTYNEKWNLLLDCIGVATFIGGWNAKHSDDISLMITALMPDISGRFRVMTEGELKSAFENGAKGYYGETAGISVVGCIKWISCYQMDATRKTAKQELEKVINKELPRPKNTRGENRQFIAVAFSKFIETGFYQDYGN